MIGTFVPEQIDAGRATVPRAADVGEMELILLGFVVQRSSLVDIADEVGSLRDGKRKTKERNTTVLRFTKNSLREFFGLSFVFSLSLSSFPLLLPLIFIPSPLHVRKQPIHRPAISCLQTNGTAPRNSLGRGSFSIMQSQIGEKA